MAYPLQKLRPHPDLRAALKRARCAPRRLYARRIAQALGVREEKLSKLFRNELPADQDNSLLLNGVAMALDYSGPLTLEAL